MAVSMSPSNRISEYFRTSNDLYLELINLEDMPKCSIFYGDKTKVKTNEILTAEPTYNIDAQMR